MPDLLLGRMCIVIIDTHSKWTDVLLTSSASAVSTVRLCRRVFATHGVPVCIVSDNGGSYIGKTFKEFTLHPPSNGLTENAVEHSNGGMKKMRGDGDLDTCFSRFLFNYLKTGVSLNES